MNDLTYESRFSAMREGEVSSVDGVTVDLYDGGQLSIDFQICIIPGGNRSEFSEDVVINDCRSIFVRNRKRPILFESIDEGSSWRKIDLGHELNSPLIRLFTLSDGRHIVQSGDPLQTMCFDAGWKLLFKDRVSKYKWHGTSSIDQAKDGTVMFSEYRGTNSDESFVEPLGVWRLKSGSETWERVFSHDAHGRETEKYIRHFHSCMSDPYIPGRWYISSGDIREQNRFWVSDDSGDNWREIPAIVSPGCAVKKHEQMRAFRFTSAIITKDFLYWVTDDDLGTGSSALVLMDKKSEGMPIEILCRFDRNLMRSLTLLENGLLLCVSESKDDTSCADVYILSDKGDILGGRKLPNLSGERCPVTLSLGSKIARNGLAFFPLLGRILTSRRDAVMRIKLGIDC